MAEVEEANVTARKGHCLEQLVAEILSSLLEHVDQNASLMRRLLGILVNPTVKYFPAVTQKTKNELENPFYI